MMQIETARLILRDFIADDWRDVMAYQTDPRYLQFYEWTAADRTPEAVQEFVGWFLAHQQQEPRHKFQLAVTVKADPQRRVIGNCAVRMDAPDSLKADIGYEFSPNHWGNGYATEAARAMVAYGFTQLKVHRIWAHSIADNTGSANVLRKLGMRLEGRLRENEYFKDRWWDTLMWGMLKSEWEGLS